MNFSKLLAQHYRALLHGGNWTGTNLKEVLCDITWNEAKTKISDLNTILALTFHIDYYVTGTLEVFNGRPLNIRDKYSYDHPDITNENQWELLRNGVFEHAESLATHIENLSDEKLFEVFVDKKYGNYFRNINGIIEHTHYHLGQISLIKKMIRAK